MKTQIAIVTTFVLAMYAGCSSSGSVGTQKLPVGSACSADADCGTAPFHCMQGDHPGGYCMRDCDIKNGDGDCPSEAICQYDGMKGECHKKCTATDCRVGYFCSPASTDANNKASHAFCDVSPDMPDGGADH